MDYDAAVEAQKNGDNNSSLMNYIFRGKSSDGIEVIFNCKGVDVQNATRVAVRYCELNDIEYLGRVTSKRSAYDRVREEQN